MKIFSIYLYLFFLLFGPKVAGYIDTSIIANFACLFFLRLDKKKLDPFVWVLLLGIWFLILSYMGVAIYYESFDIVYVGRLIRSSCTVLCLFGFCHYVRGYLFDEKIEWMTNVLFVHAIVVILSATVFLEIQNFLRPFNDFQAHVRPFRSTGLMAGFDISGLLCNIGVTLVLINKKFNMVKFFVFSIAVLLTSRFSIVYFVLVLLLYLVFFNKQIEKKKFACILIPLVFASCVGLILLAITTSNIISENLVSTIDFSSSFLESLKYTYAHSDLYVAGEGNYKFPDSFLTCLFGLGFYGGGDPGYVHIINCVGIFGLFLVVSWHVYFLFHIVSIKLFDKMDMRRKRFIEFIFTLILFTLNFKNTYFFTGTFFEIMFFIFYSYMMENHKNLIVYEPRRQRV